MAQLQTIRSGVFGIIATALVALGLLMFIVDPSEIASAFQNMSSKYDVGEIGGKNITYTDFKEDVDRLSSINEMLTGGRSLNAEQQAQTRDAAWQDLIYKHLFIKNAEKAYKFIDKKLPKKARMALRRNTSESHRIRLSDGEIVYT